MGKTIKFKAVRTETKHKRSISCDSPIVVNRVGKDTLTIGFRLDCFAPSIVENSLKRVFHAQSQWKLYRIGQDNPNYQQIHVTYLVHVTGDLSRLELDEIFTQIVSLITKEVYSEEVSVWGSKVRVGELATPYTVEPFDGLTVKRQTVSILQNAGMESAYDVATHTRESLCRLPGMTAQEVCKVEKSLATRGLYLNTAEVPKWHK